jgi:hypothetical protein
MRPEYQGEASIEIAAPRDAVFAYVADFTRHNEWNDNISKVTPLTPGIDGVGARFRAAEGPPPVPITTRLRMMAFFMAGLATGIKSYSEAEVTALEPGRRISWFGFIPKGSGAFNRTEWEIEFADCPAGTRLTQRFRYQPQTGAAEGMIGSAGSSRLADAALVNLRALKRLLERRAPVAA